MLLLRVPLPALFAYNAGDLQLQLPLLAASYHPSLKELCQHLKAHNTDGVLPLLPGGALALGGRLQKECAAAGELDLFLFMFVVLTFC
jgi:hypothetical protein